MQNNIYTLIPTQSIARPQINYFASSTINYESPKPTNWFLKTHNTGIKANALLITPDPSKAISAQIRKTIITNLPDPAILKSEHLEIYFGPARKPVTANPDGTYCYGTRDLQLAAVSIFLSLSKQLQVYLDLGLRQPTHPLKVIIADPYVPDNAYFDPKNYELHIGIGTGVKYGGLTKNLALDLSVANHEFGHALLFLQTIDSDLPGKHGAAIHEAVADVLGALVMDYLSRLWYSNKGFTLADLINDRRIIGRYALPPLGIRSQKNMRKFPQHVTGEPHSDGLIIGGALADLLVAIASQPNTILEDQIKLFTRMNLLALALLPSLNVSFKDLLRALIVADRQICSALYRPCIEQCFANHGIILNTTTPIDHTTQNLRIIQ